MMRCYYSDTFERLVREHGYQVLSHWGGYEVQPYGAGPEFVVQFSAHL